MRLLKRRLLNSLFAVCAASTGWANSLSGSDIVITKDLLGATGNARMSSADYTLAFAWGEPVSGNVVTDADYSLISGYFGGRFGTGQTMKLMSHQIGTAGAHTFFQDQVQVGVAFDAPVQITFSDPVDLSTVPGGLQVRVAADHLGRTSNAAFDVAITTGSDSRTLILRPQGTWWGNTLYDVVATPDLYSDMGYSLDRDHHIYFVTLLNHREENVVLEPVIPAAVAADAALGSAGVLSIGIPTESLSDFSAVLLSRDPLHAPLRVDPQIIQEANEKARAAGGPYRVPLAIQEISAYDTKGELVGRLSRPAQMTMSYGGAMNAPGASSQLVRPQTFALWVLDESHKLWVKMPASQNSVGLRTVSAPVTQFSVFALMGSADGSAVDSYVYPTPWRPHGPNAGTGAGETGTEADGINFAAIPSECTIKIFTIAGDLVRTIRHSDVGGSISREKWDVKTAHGDAVASGVYLWRVESSVDSKNGKLMVIR